MDSPERWIGLEWPQAGWRWVANLATLGIFGMGLLATAWRGTGLLAAGVIVLAALMDGADGALARRAGGPSHTGAVLDIVADFAAFGVAPAGLALARAPAGAWPLAAALALYLAASLARLIRSARLVFTKSPGLYVGLPMPTAGCLVAGLALNLPAGWVGVAALVVSGLAISRRPYPSVPWMWQQRRVNLLIFVAATVLVTALSPRAGLLFGAAVCAAYPWIKPVKA
jgi:CDP-diacylglycerol---serine O-phosphatidyltransferase